MFEITKYNGETNQTKAECRINDGALARRMTDQRNAERPMGSSDYYSVRMVTGPWA